MGLGLEKPYDKSFTVIILTVFMLFHILDHISITTESPLSSLPLSEHSILSISVFSCCSVLNYFFYFMTLLLSKQNLAVSQNCWIIEVSGVNGKPVYRISFRLGRNDEIRKEYLRTGY